MAVDAGMADRAQRDARARKLSFLGPAGNDRSSRDSREDFITQDRILPISVFFLRDKDPSVHYGFRAILYISFIYGIYNNISLFFMV